MRLFNKGGRERCIDRPAHNGEAGLPATVMDHKGRRARRRSKVVWPLNGRQDAMEPMYFPCPSCKRDIPISPQNAGGAINCPHCGAPVPVPPEQAALTGRHQFQIALSSMTEE